MTSRKSLIVSSSSSLPMQHRLIDRHRADRHRRRGDDRLARDVDVLAGGEVHHRVGAVLHREQELLDLLIDRRGDGGVPDVRVDLDRGDLADAHGLELAGEVVDVGGDDEAAAGDFVADELGARVDSRWATNSMAGVISPLRARRIWVLAVRGVDMDELGICDSLRRYEPDQVQRVFLSPRAGVARRAPRSVWGILAEILREKMGARITTNW